MIDVGLASTYHNYLEIWSSDKQEDSYKASVSQHRNLEAHTLEVTQIQKLPHLILTPVLPLEDRWLKVTWYLY